MSQTILIHDNTDTKNTLTLTLEAMVGTHIIHRKSAEDAIELLEILPEISLVISKDCVADEITALKVFHFLKSRDSKIPMIILGPCPELSEAVVCLPADFDLETLVQETTKILGLEEEELGQNSYAPVGLHYFYHLKNSPCDVFIRIKQKSSEFIFIKRIHAQGIFDREDIDRYGGQGLQEFFILTRDLHRFKEFVSSKLIDTLNQKNLSLEESIIATANAHQIIRDMIQRTGLDEDSIRLSEASIQSMLMSVIHSPEISGLLKFIFSQNISYAYQLCFLQTLISHYIMSKQSWYQSHHLEAISFVSFFADITLALDEEIQVKAQHDLDEASFSPAQKQKILQHPLDALKAVGLHPLVTGAVRTILTESHGAKYGLGIEDDPTEDLHVLSKIFIVADHFVKILLNPDLPSSKKDILSILYDKFSNPSYKKIIRTLEVKFD